MSLKIIRERIADAVLTESPVSVILKIDFDTTEEEEVVKEAFVRKLEGGATLAGRHHIVIPFDIVPYSNWFTTQSRYSAHVKVSVLLAIVEAFNAEWAGHASVTFLLSDPVSELWPIAGVV